MTQYAEHHLNTREQVRGYLSDALDIVAELGPPEDLRELAFSRACDWLANKQVTMQQPQALNLTPDAIKRLRDGR
jgi:hypothetical protein